MKVSSKRYEKGNEMCEREKNQVKRENIVHTVTFLLLWVELVVSRQQVNLNKPATVVVIMIMNFIGENMNILKYTFLCECIFMISFCSLLAKQVKYVCM